MEKGLSPIVSVILILIIAISLTILTMIWLPKFSFNILPKLSFNESYVRTRGCLSIEDVKGLFGFFTLKNCGKIALSDLKLFLDSKLLSKLNIGILESSQSVSFYDMPIPGGMHEIYVTADYAESQIYKLNVPFWECIGGEPLLTDTWYVSKTISCICSYNTTIPLYGRLHVIGNGSLSFYNCNIWLGRDDDRLVYVRNDGFLNLTRSKITKPPYEWGEIYFEDNSTVYLLNSTIDNPSPTIQDEAKITAINSNIGYPEIISNIINNLSISNFYGVTSCSIPSDSPATKYIKADGSNFTLNFTNVTFNYINFEISDNSNNTLNNVKFNTIGIRSEYPHNLTIRNWGCAPSCPYIFNNFFKAQGSNFAFNGTNIYSGWTRFYANGNSNNTIIDSCVPEVRIDAGENSTNKFINNSAGGDWYLYGRNYTMDFINSRFYNNQEIVISDYGWGYIPQVMWNFSNTTFTNRRFNFYDGNITIFGNVTFIGSNNYFNNFYSSVNVTRYFPTVIRDSSGYPFPTMQPAIINITNINNQSIWNLSVSGGGIPTTYYTEYAKIIFNNSNYQSGNFLMNASQVCENVSNISFFNSTPLDVTIKKAFEYDGASFNTQTARGLAFSNNVFWVAASNGNVYNYTSTGSYISNFNSGLSSLRDVASNGTHLWLLDSSTSKVYRYSTGGVSDGWSFPVSQVSEPYAVDFDGESFWVLGNISVYKYNSLGCYTSFYFNLDRLATPLSFPDIVASSGKLWIVTDTYSTDRGRGVFRYNINGVYDNWYFDIAPTATSGYGLAFNGTYFWVMNSAGTVYRYRMNRNCSMFMRNCDEFVTILPYTINKNNTRYCLLYDLYIPSRTAIDFSKSIKNSSLDCLGYSIDGNDVINTYGINLTTNTNNNTVKNCNVTDFYNGIYVTYNSNNIITNNIAKSNTYGIWLWSTTNNTLVSNKVDGNDQGIYLTTSHNNSLINNTANSNIWGIGLTSSHNNSLINNTANSNWNGGFIMSSSSNNTITGGSIAMSTSYGDYYLEFSGATNNFTNTNFTTTRTIHFDDTNSWFNYRNDSTNNIWLKTNVSAATTITRKLTKWSQYFMQWNDTSDTSITARYNITGLAPNENYNIYNNSVLLGGSPFNSGPSGSLSFTIYLPQNQEREIKVKGLCDYYIFSSDLPYTISQNNSLYCAGENLYISGNNATIFASGIKNSTLDCKGKRIYSNDYSNTFGVYMRTSTINNTVKNCNISNFDTGVRLQNSYNNTITNNKIYSNSNNIHFSYSINNTITNNNLTQSSEDNVDLYESDKNIVENNVISEITNTDGVLLRSNSDENILRNNTLINTVHGFCNSGGTSNKFYNNTIRWTTSMSGSIGFNLLNTNSFIIENNIISGLDASNSNGIHLTGSSAKNNTIKNCKITDFNNGIYSENGANNNTISSNTINSSTTYGIYLVLSSNDTLINNTINNSGNVGIDFVSSYNNTITNSTVTNSAWSGVYFYSSSNNTLINNAANNNYNGIYFESSSNNSLTTNIVNNNNYVGITLVSSYSNSIIDGSVYSTPQSNQFDFWFASAGSNNLFRNTNFTSTRKIRFDDTVSWFNYNNESSGNIWLKTNVSSNYEHINRKLNRWSQDIISWNDTSDDSSITARYNITGLLPNLNYNVYNNSLVPVYTLQAINGEINFTIYLPQNQERNITVQRV